MPRFKFALAHFALASSAMAACLVSPIVSFAGPSDRGGEPSDLMDFAFRVVGRTLAVAFGVALLVVMVLGVANAQDVAVGAAAAQASTVVDFGPLANLALEYVAPALGSILLGLGAWVLAAIRKKTGWQIDAAAGAILDRALEQAVNYAVVRLQDHKIGGIPIDTKSEAVATALGYAQRSIPDAVAHFGITPDRLEEMVEARLQGWLIDPAVEVTDFSSARLRSAALPSAG